jgi:hypothetical protein
MGGKFHLKLNNGERPIANKYREGKMKRTLKRELKVLEIAKREALETSDMFSQSPSALLVCVSRWKLGLRDRNGGRWFMIGCESRSIRGFFLWEKVARKVGEQSLLYSCYSTSAWIEEVMVRRLRLGPAFLWFYLL